MIRIVNRRLQAPSRLEINGMVVARSFGYNIHSLYKKIAPNAGPGDQIVDSITYTGNNLIVAVSIDDSAQHGLLLHASVSHRDHNPSWETIRAMKEVVFGDTDVMMVLPKRTNYVNLHSHSFHLWQMPFPWDIR